MKRGEIRWYAFRPPDKRRPILLLTRDAVIEQLGELIAVPITRTIRGLGTEVLLTPDDGMPVLRAPTSFNPHPGPTRTWGQGSA
jgi:mRNA interferase MazF